jgi:hypothetical protein
VPICMTLLQSIFYLVNAGDPFVVDEFGMMFHALLLSGWVRRSQTGTHAVHEKTVWLCYLKSVYEYVALRVRGDAHTLNSVSGAPTTHEAVYIKPLCRTHFDHRHSRASHPHRVQYQKTAHNLCKSNILNAF